MPSIKVIGGKQLKGELEIQGSKNGALPVIAATILNKGRTILRNCPKILDVFHMINILEELGCKTTWRGNTLYVDTRVINSSAVSQESVRKMRSSILFLGSLIGRCNEVTIAYPGGCSIGERPIGYHLDALEKLNVKQEFSGENQEIIRCKTSGVIGRDIYLEFPSVGATQNIILATVISKGVTRIFNAAREPEVAELCNYLVKAGAKISSKDTLFLQIEGVEKLHDIEYNISSDRIVAGTYMAAVAATGGDVIFLNTPNDQLNAIVQVLEETGCQIEGEEDFLRIVSNKRPRPIKTLETQPYPGFPTDMQSQLMTVLSIADGESTIIEKIFESRYQNVSQLKKMGTKIEVDGKKAKIKGVNKLQAASVYANDLRGGAALVIAGLIAEGTTIVNNSINIQRGYEDICRDLSLLGADIEYCNKD